LTTACGSQWATVTTSSSYLSASDPRVHFGLGKVDADVAIEIHWPSGIVQTLTHLRVDQEVQVDEPRS
jgi:enediyne biosynthesis protein E4